EIKQGEEEPKYTFTAHKEAYDISFSKDNQLLVSSGKDGISLWIIDGENAGKNKGKIDAKKQNESIYSVDFQPNNTLVAYGRHDGSIGIWDWQQNQNKLSPIGNIRKSEDSRESVNLVRFSPDGTRFASVGDNGTIKIWDFEDSEKPQLLAEIIKGHESNDIRGFWLSSNNKILASSSSDNSIKIWKLEEVFKQYQNNQTIKQDDKTVTVLKGHTDSVNRVEISNDNKFIVSASEDGTVRVWDYNPSQIVKHPQLDKLYNSSCEFLRNYLKYSKSPDDEVKKLCL
ncbi:MAG: WD40 repeat domain-containing protein, partial [Mastigocoleus sp. MO_167.B18]|nr:WD40 repeat domain-containing protein [Mastigocoleus sp. MO_167.B18]